MTRNSMCITVVLLLGIAYLSWQTNNCSNSRPAGISQDNYLQGSRNTGTWLPVVLPLPGCFLEFHALSIPGLSSLECKRSIVVGDGLSLVKARDKYYEHMLRLHVKCPDKELLGKAGDGGWWACKAEAYHFKKGCLVYSFGIRDDWSFDEAISTKYGCEVHAFDPSIGKEDHKHSDLIYFHNVGLGGENEVNDKEWKMRTLCTLVKELGHVNRTIDYLKFDIEFSEWEAMAAMLREGCLAQVKQISFEVHSWGDTLGNYTLYWQDLQGLENMGFLKWRLLNRNWRCFKPKDDPKKRRCPQTDMNYINMNSALQLQGSYT